MADIKISALSALTGANTATDDVYVVVDTSVPETKKQTRAELFQNVPASSFAGANVFNDAGADVDQRIEGDTDANLVFVDASTDRVGIGTATPTAKLQVNGSFALTAPVTVTTDYTVAATANFIISNRAAATNTITLPTASTNTGRIIKFMTRTAQLVISASSNVVQRTGASAGTATSAILPATIGAWAELVSDGTNWIIVTSSA
tara:strand:+ start:24723 stop:25337 length:615 start_codon:yes stop_codon:yes gene_type:complete